MRTLTVFGAAGGLLLTISLLAAPSAEPAAEAGAAPSEAPRAATRRTRQHVSRADQTRVPDDVRPAPAVQQSLDLARQSATDLAIWSAPEWGPSGNEDRPALTDRERVAAWSELCARDDTAIEELVELLLHGARRNDRHAAEQALVRLGARAVPTVLLLLRSDDVDERDGSLSVLWGLARRPEGLGRQRAVVLGAVLAACDHPDADTAECAEELLAALPGCLPAVADRLALGDEAQRLSALRILSDVEDELQLPRVQALLESAAWNRDETQAVRDAATFRLAWCIDWDASVAPLPDPAGLPSVGLWALWLACDEDDAGDPCLAALVERRHAATALFLETARRGRDPEVVEHAVGALANVADDPLPLLIDLARSAELTATRWHALDAIALLAERGRIETCEQDAVNTLSALLADADQDVGWSAALAIAGLGIDGHEVIPQLLRALDDHGRAEMAAYALESIGPAAAAAADRLVRLVHDPTASIDLHYFALDALAAVDEGRAASAAQALLTSLSPEIRWSAARVLLQGAADTDGARAAAVICLGDPDADVRWVAASWLEGDVQPTAETCHAAATALADPEPRIRCALAKFLARADPTLPGACESILACLRDADPSVRSVALGANDLLAACAERAGPLLIGLLQRAQHDDMRVLAGALARLGIDARPAVPAMMAALADRHGRPRFDVALALGRLGEDGQAARPLLADWVRRGLDNESDDLLEALEMLHWMPEPRDVPQLVALLHAGGGEEYDGGTWTALEALERAGSGAAAAVPRLLAAARASAKLRRARLVEALGHVSRGEPDVLAFLIAELRSSDRQDGGCCNWSWDVPAEAAEALGRIGPRADAAVQALQDAASAPDSRAQRKATEALRAITGRVGTAVTARE